MKGVVPPPTLFGEGTSKHREGSSRTVGTCSSCEVTGDGTDKIRGKYHVLHDFELGPSSKQRATQLRPSYLGEAYTWACSRAMRFNSFGLTMSAMSRRML